MVPESSRDDAGVMLGGAYRADSTTQYEAAAIGYPLIEDAVGALPSPDSGDGPVVIADFGAAQGTNSLQPISLALDSLSARELSPPAVVVHTDLPGNDFAGLFDTVDRSTDSYLVDRPDVFPLVAGRSFYERIFPADTLAFGWSSSSLHWLSTAPGPIPDHFFVHQSHDSSSRIAYAARSTSDWTTFLDHRSVELQVGAGVVIVDVLRGNDGLVGSEALFDCLAEALRAALEQGVLSDSEYARMVYPTWFRSVDDLHAPFDPVFTGRTGGQLDLVDLTTTVLADPFGDLLAHNETAEYAAKQTGFLRAFLAPSFASQLDPGRDAAAKARLLERIWAGTRDLIAAHATSVAPAYRLSAVRITRTR
jgi:hypothetical protein